MTIAETIFRGPPVLRDPDTLTTLLQCLTDAGWEPTKWSVNERGGVPYVLEDAVQRVRDGELGLFFRRLRAPKWEGYFDTSGATSGFVIEHASLPLSRMPEHWARGDALASILTPDFGDVAALPWDPLPGITTLEEYDDADQVGLRRMSGCASGFFHNGISGLSTRTYFGPNYIEQLGREFLMATPALVTELAWGGIRIDLHERPWEATPQELLAVYHPAMRHLRQSPVLTTLKPRTRADGTLAVDVKKGPAFKMVDYRKPAPHV